MKKRGWISSEVVLVLVVMMVLLMAGTYGYQDYVKSSRSTAAWALTAKMHGAIAQYHYEMKAYPASLAALNVQQGIYGPWIRETIPAADPFGHAYNYTSSVTGFAVWSNGPDGMNQSGGGVPSSMGGDDIGYIGQ